MNYIQVTSTGELPGIEKFAPFKAVLAVEDDPDTVRRASICDWLVQSGALYIMVQAPDCDAWRDAIRKANTDLVSIDDMTEKEFVMITMHPRERLRNVFWHAKKHARHTHVELNNLLVIHLGEQNRSMEYISLFDKA